MTALDNGLAGAGENIKKILEHLLKSSCAGTTPPRKRQSRGPTLSLGNDNQRSAISEIARAQRPAVDLMSPKSHSRMYSHGGDAGSDGQDDETQGNENEIVDLGEEKQYAIPCTQRIKDNMQTGKGKAVVVLDSQSGGEENDDRSMGVRVEKYFHRRPQQLQGQQQKKKKNACTTQGGKGRMEKDGMEEDNVLSPNTQIYNLLEDEGDDSDTEIMVTPRRGKNSVDVDGEEGEGIGGSVERLHGRRERKSPAGTRTVGGTRSDEPRRSTQANRMLKLGEQTQNKQVGRAAGVPAAEVPPKMVPRKNGVRCHTTSMFRSLYPSQEYLSQWQQELLTPMPVHESHVMVGCAGAFAVQYAMLDAASGLSWQGCCSRKGRCVREVQGQKVQGIERPM